MLMDFMRRNTRRFLIAITILIVPAFILWGSFPSLSGKGRGNGAFLTVGGQKVSLEEFERYYQRVREMTRQNFGANYSPEIEKMLNLKQQALDGMIREMLLTKEIDRLNIVVSDQEVQDSLKANPAFQTDGKFDAAKWNKALENPQIQWPAVAEQERESLRTQKLMGIIFAEARVTDDEIRDEFNRQNEKVRIAFIPIKANDLADKVEVTPDDLKAYYEQHKQEYSEPAQDKIEYVELKKTPSSMDFADMKRFAQEQLEKIRGGADFAEIAQTYSDDALTKAKGGDLGFFGDSPRLKEFQKVALTMKAGEIGDLIQAPDGFYIVKVEEVRGEGAKKEVHASDIFFKVEPSDDTTLSLQEQAAKLASGARTSSLDKVAADMKLTVVSTPLFAENNPAIPTLGAIREISGMLPGLKEGVPSDVIETPAAFYVVVVKERKPERVPELTELEAKVRTAVKAQKALELAKTKAEELVKEVNEKGLSLAGVKSAPKAQETAPFTRRGFPPELPRINGLVDAVFELPTGKAAGPFVGPDGAYVAQLKEKIEPDAAKFEDQKSAIKDKLLAQRKQQIFEDYYENLKAKADIKLNQELFQSA